MKIIWQITGENLKLIWLTIPPVLKSCSELVKCGCKTGCRGRCKCKKSELACTELYNCNGNCYYATHLVGWQRNFYLLFNGFCVNI